MKEIEKCLGYKVLCWEGVSLASMTLFDFAKGSHQIVMTLYSFR
jgi:hypothetical protein